MDTESCICHSMVKAFHDSQIQHIIIKKTEDILSHAKNWLMDPIPIHFDPVQIFLVLLIQSLFHSKMSPDYHEVFAKMLCDCSLNPYA